MPVETRAKDGGSSEAYDAFARRVVASGILLDPWIGGEPRLSPEPLLLDAEKWRALERVGEDVAELYDEACRLGDGDDELVETVFGLTPPQKLMWDSSRPPWPGPPRAGGFRKARGEAITEAHRD